MRSHPSMRYAATRDGRDIGFLSYFDAWLDPHLTRDWRGIFDVDDIETPEDRSRLRQLIAESDEIRPGRLVRHEDDAEEVVHRRGEHAYRFEAFTWRLKEAGYTLRPADTYDDIA
jgi:hypothetical protein